MKYLDLTLPDPAGNLACDEALIELLENTEAAEGLLRTWESKSHFVVLGHSNKLNLEVDSVACEMQQVAISRRLSGGGTVVQGPGCLNYTLVLRSGVDAPATIGESFRFVLEKHKRCIEAMTGARVAIAGTSDLTIDGKKISGNAQYRKRRFALLHGTFLLDLNLEIVDRCLLHPPNQPEYRKNRAHRDFIANLQLRSADVCKTLMETWRASDRFLDVPTSRIAELVRSRYGCAEWTAKF
jgi:lipoate-protein ligase A